MMDSEERATGDGEERYARLAGRLLSEEQQDCARVDTQRDAIIAAMALAMAAKKRRRRLAAGSAILVAAAATAAFVVWSSAKDKVPGVGSETESALESALIVERETGHGNRLVRGGSTQPLSDLGVLAVGDSVRSDAESTATLAFGNGTRILLSPMGQLQVDELGATRRFSLLGGRLQARVAKLGTSERFVVTTPDSEIEVRGTEFTVAVDGPASSCRNRSSTSTVFVSEGAVWVRSRAKEIVLRGGETWTTPCEDARASDVVVAPAAKTPSARASKPAGESAAPKDSKDPKDTSPAPAPGLAPRPPVASSSLAEQNDLFFAATMAERRGQHDLALRKLNELLSRFADGPLGESARAERERILSDRPSR